MDREIDRRIGAAAAVMRSMSRSVVVKKELSRKAKLSIYQSIYVPTLTYGHELWVMTERVRSRIQVAEMRFLRRVAGRSHRDRVKSSVTREELGVEPLLLHIKRGQLRWLGHLFWMPPGRLPGEVFRACPTGKRPRGRPRTRWRDYVSRLAWERLGVPPEELEEVSGERSGHPCLDCCPRNLAPDKRKTILTQGFAQLDLGVYEEQLNQMEKSPNEVKMSFVYTEDQAQTDMSDTQIDKSHKDFTGKEMTLLDVRASDMRKERHIEQYCSEKIGTVTKDGLDQEFRVENLSKYLKKSSEYTSFIAFVYIEATKERLSIYQTKMKNLITAGTTLQLLEAQAAIGHVIDLSSDGNLTVSEAVKMGVVGPEFKSKLLFAEQAVTGYKDPYLPNGKLSLLQAIKKDIVLESQGIRLLKFQIATGGIIDSENSHRLPVDVAYKCGLFDEKMYRILTDPSSDTKGFFDPNTKKNLTYSQLMEQCITDPKTGHSFLLLKEKKTFCF
ncbi:hypothetical protein QTP70_011363 [Hemibagrus guttatus]|uniref:Uncharacterized protein n=1 Tax=Hemibagrus guttatus TaxID=175788 RepID=A0AAE0R7M4_9TELE|nr:hypothetical protein QTP70_011363 [Hemibagrus guttatus]KAK3567081.1 hypothetical protein QTP86_009777 [Hemibagrus guttatus]